MLDDNADEDEARNNERGIRSLESRGGNLRCAGRVVWTSRVVTVFPVLVPSCDGDNELGSEEGIETSTRKSSGIAVVAPSPLSQVVGGMTPAE